MLICVRAAGINPRPCGRAASNDALQKKIDRILAGVDRSGICVRAASTELSGSFLESLVDASRDQLGTLPGHLLPECCQPLGLIAQTLSMALAVAATTGGGGQGTHVNDRSAQRGWQLLQRALPANRYELRHTRRPHQTTL